MRCVSVEYSDYPVVEWTVYFRNAGNVNTPILERIEALDARWERPDGGEFVSAASKAISARPDSYEPYEMTLGPNVQKLRARRADGRPTTPFPTTTCDAWRRVIVAVGWPGQWATISPAMPGKGCKLPRARN